MKYESKNLKKIIIDIVKLLSGGLLTSICLVLIASPKWSFLGKNESIFFIKYYQWELLGLTVSKLGVDQINYALVIEKKKEQLDLKYYIFRNSLFVLIFCFLTYCFVSLSSNLWIIILLFFTIVFDLYSIFYLSTLNALRKFDIILISNVLNYPLFFSLLYVYAIFKEDLGKNFITCIDDTSNLIIAVIFLFSSLVRAFYIFLVSNAKIKIKTNRVADLKYSTLGLQQILNYLLFKFDQVLLSVFNEYSFFLFVPNEDQRQILFYGRIPEVYTSVSTSLSTLYIESGSRLLLQKLKKRYVLMLFVVLFFLGMVLFYLYAKTMGGIQISLQDDIAYWIAYSLQLILILPANILTFIFIRNKSFKMLNSILLASITIIGIVVLIFSLFNNRQFGMIVKFIVPAQLFLYIIFCYMIVHSRFLNKNNK